MDKIRIDNILDIVWVLVFRHIDNCDRSDNGKWSLIIFMAWHGLARHGKDII